MVAAIAHAAGIPLMVDATLTTPVLSRPNDAGYYRFGARDLYGFADGFIWLRGAVGIALGGATTACRSGRYRVFYGFDGCQWQYFVDFYNGRHRAVSCGVEQRRGGPFERKFGLRRLYCCDYGRARMCAGTSVFSRCYVGRG